MNAARMDGQQDSGLPKSGLSDALLAKRDTKLSVPPSLIPLGCTAITPEMLPLIDLEPKHIEQIVRTVPNGARNVQDIYPLSPLQEGLLFHHIMDSKHDTYAVLVLLEMQSRAHLDAFVAALRHVIDRHDILRSAFLWKDLPRPLQVVYRQAVLEVKELQLDSLGDPIEQLKEKMRPELQSLDLDHAPLLRLQVAHDGKNPQWYALLTIHHLLADGQSMEIIITEIMAHIEGRARELPVPVQFRAHVAQALEGERTHDAEIFFRRKLGEVDEPTAPYGLVDVFGDGNRLDTARRTLEVALARRIHLQSRLHRVTPAALFHAAWALVISHITGKDDVVFGSVLLGRWHLAGSTKQRVGLFLNTLPLCLQLQEATVKDLVLRTQSELFELLSYEQTSLAVAQRCSNIAGSAPLFTTLLNYRREREWTSAAHGYREVATRSRTNYPMTLSIDDLGESLTVTAETDRRIDPQRIVEYVYTAVHSLVGALEQAPKTPALSLAMLPESERRQVLEEFNATRKPYPQGKRVHELFEEQVQRTPGAVAVVYEDDSLTYAELNAKANQLAHYLRVRQSGPDQLVGICVERSLEMVVGLLGILKAGGAYVPLDPSHPSERLQYMLEDAAPKVLLTQARLTERLHQTDAEVIALDEQWGEIAQQPCDDLDLTALGLRSHHLAYVIYTSGSTGRPKGAMNEHRGVVNRLQWMQDQYQLGSLDRVLQKTPFSFDVSVWEFFWTLMSGARLVMARPEGHKDPAYLCKLIQEAGVTRLHFVPSMLQSFLDHDGSGDCSSLRHVVCSGEELPAPLQKKCSKRLPQVRLSNLYGPTEAAVDVTAWECSPEDQSTRVPIGRPISNIRMYLLGPDRQPVPIDVAGEIYIAGVGVGRGYLNRPQLTAERFIQDPFSTDPQARMYKTGDLGRWRADGNIEYLGRNDNQVKIRGFRIELGEIEAQLLRHPQVKEAVVLAREDEPGEKRLVAYVVGQHTSYVDSALSVETLRAHLKRVLPDHMLPSAFVMLDSLPLSANGKLDRRAMQAPERSAYGSRGYEAPQGEIEEILAGIWQALLKVERVGRQDNFFELGGHSLLIVQMLERLRRVGLSAEVRRVFDSATLADLASVLGSTSVEQFAVPPNLIPLGCEAITPQMLTLVDLEAQHIERIVQAVPGGAGNIQDIYLLAPLQEGLLFHHVLDAQRGDTYLINWLLCASSQEGLEQLIATVQGMIDRHDILRTAVLWEQLPQPVQVVYRRAIVPVQEIVPDPGQDPVEALKEQMRPEGQRLDLRQAPLLRLKVASDPHSGQRYALIQLQHIICDHETAAAFLAEMIGRFEGQEKGAPDSVPYRNHVAQALAHARTHDADSFFRSKLGDIEEPTAPFGLVDVRGYNSQIEAADNTFEPDLSRRVRAQARRLSVSAATLFHAACALVVARTSGRDDVVFGTVLLGRLQGSVGAQRTLGIFINTLPLRLPVREVTAKELVEQTQRGLVELLHHEQSSLALAQRCSGVPGSTPLFSTLVNYRHSPPGEAEGWSQTSGIRMLAAQDRTNFPIHIAVDDLGEGFAVTVQTDRRVDPQRMVEYVCTAMRSLVEALEHAPRSPALSLSILPESERRQVLELFNATQVAYPHEKLVHGLFEEQVQRTPGALAVVYEGHSLTYAELNAKANQLAQYLRERQIGPDQLVGICVERSLEMVVGLLGILKAGGAYVPLDPNYPPERLQYMLADAAPRVLLTQGHLKERLPSSAAEVIAVDEQWGEIARRPADNLEASALGLRPHHLAYVIYTSGSTGQPKGAMNEHRGVVNRMQWMQDQYRLGDVDRVLQKTPFSFDVSGWEFFWTLMSGARLIVARPEGHKDPSYLRALIEETGVTTLHFVPSMLQSFLDQHQSGECSSLHHIVCSGEELSPSLQRKCFEQLPQVQLSNLYGPTEAAIDVTVWECSPEDFSPRVPIGRPISNIQMYVLDRERQPVPIAVAGEIYIGGVGVGRGYLNRSQLTAERFINDPFSHDPQARLYKTGDLGRWRADGNIEYLGRNDSQVKIRGFRIELGEIEARLLQHPQVKEAAVLAREDEPGEKRLVAYVVGNRKASLRATPDSGAETLRTETVDSWKTLYEETYGTESRTGGPSFVGWNSSYTGQPIPESEMQEWLSSTVERIQALQPRKILDIGCGVGLFLQHLAPRCEVYVATEISTAALGRLHQWIKGRDDLQHVQLLHRSAIDLQDLPQGSFDTVVLNSVVQYFPDIEYLIAVLQGAIRLLGPGGRIFLGDIRHLGSLPLFHAMVQLGKAADAVSVGQLKKRITRALAQEKELVVDPQFFQVLPGSLPGISSSEIQLKRGRASNELTRHRYDVVLHVGEQIGDRAVPAQVTWQMVGSAAALETALREHRWSAVQLCAIPNVRLAEETALQRLLETSHERQEVGVLRRQVTELPFEEVSPEMFFDIGQVHGYEVSVSPSAQGTFEVTLVDRARADRSAGVMPFLPATVKSWSSYANDPLESSFTQQLIPQLREYLKVHLPDYMIPSYWLALRQLPLTPSGKLDRLALAAPEGRPEEMGEYVAPRTDLERTLAEIWAQVLRVDRVGVHDNFFELGGHSLLGMKLISKIASTLAFQPPVATIFQYPTVAEMARLLEELLLRDADPAQDKDNHESAQYRQAEGVI